VGNPGDPGRQVDIVLPAGEVQTRSLPPVKVSNVEVGEESVRFDVDRTGVPVLVKVSYFPNWRVKGAAAIHRAAPNMMVVVPEETTVEMSYEPSSLDRSGYLLTFAGIALVVLFARRRFRYGTAVPPRRSVVGEDADAPVASGTDGD
jgi:uncharacterized membrane protein